MCFYLFKDGFDICCYFFVGESYGFNVQLSQCFITLLIMKDGDFGVVDITIDLNT